MLAYSFLCAVQDPLFHLACFCSDHLLSCLLVLIPSFFPNSSFDRLPDEERQLKIAEPQQREK
jgi:hypothetical protein